MTRFLWTDREITREYVIQHRELTFIYGDNSRHFGGGGMAGEMRNEPNCIGIPTKHKPDMSPSAFFTDEPAVSNRAKELIERAVQMAEARGKTIVVPTGIGTGRAQMPTRCQKLYRWMCNRMENT
jgi:hypothetical protein